MKVLSDQHTVKVEQLSPLVDEQSLRLATGNSSDIDSLKINRTQSSFNFAYINYTVLGDALHAIDRLNGMVLNGTSISAKLHTASIKWRSPSPPGTQHTVKVDRLPIYVTKDHLIQAFSAYGVVGSAKINTTQAAFNYAYVNFKDYEDAIEAIENLNASTLWGTPILVKMHKSEGVQLYNDRAMDRKLHQNLLGQVYTVKVEQLPNHVTKDMLSDTFSACGSLISIKINTTQTSFNYAYVNFMNLLSSEEAVLKFNGAKLWGSVIAVKMHNVKNVLLNQDENISLGQQFSQARDEQYTLRIDHLSGHITEKDLIGMFGTLGKLNSVKLIETQTAYNYAYIDYSTVQDAEEAIQEFDGAELHGLAMSVRLHTTSSKSRKLSAICQDQHEMSWDQQYIVKVEQLPKSVNDKDLWDLFTPFGHVKHVNLFATETDFNSAHINYTELECAEAAVCELNGSKICNNNTIHVTIHTAAACSADAAAGYVGTSTALSLCNSTSTDQLRPLLNTSTQLSTVKVLLCSKPGNKVTITGEDLQDIFGHYGTIKNLPVIKEGSPPYAFINFEVPLEAQAACTLDGKAVMEHILKVKLVTKQIEKMDIKKVPCDPLVGKLIFSHYKDDVEAVQQDVKVQLHKLNSAIKLWGEENQTLDVEKKIQAIVSKVQACIVKRTINLPCHHLPSFTTALLESAIEKIETRHFVSFKLINAQDHPMHISECVTKLSSIVQASNDALQIVDFYMFLHNKPPKLHAADSNDTYSWWWNDKKRRYTKYPSDISDQLTRHFLLSPNIPLQLHIQSKTYTINFSAMTQTNDVSGFVRSIRLTKEKQYLSKNVSDHLSPCSLQVEVSGRIESLDPALKDLTFELEKLIIECKCEINQVDPIAASLLDVTRLYCLEARVFSGELYLKGAKEYVDKVMLRIQKECILFLKQKHRTEFCGVPDEWSPQTDKVMLVQIQQSSPEWNEVATLFNLSLRTSQITMLERIQNVWQWEKFEFAKQRMLAKNNGQVNELKLFHGSRTTDPKEIYRSEQGFDFRYSSHGMWGTGSYFAVKASYSNHYCYTSNQGTKKMILARVLTGDAYRSKPDSTLKMPPLKACNSTGEFENERYDSVTGHTNGSDIYVIYDHDKAYPAYLISYV